MFKKGEKWPTLTELFFGKGVDPATYAPSYLTGEEKKVDTSRSITMEKPIKEVTKAAPKNAKTTKKPKKALMSIADDGLTITKDVGYQAPKWLPNGLRSYK